jgi:tRNA nucleotidyltransferase/poly(A) polymerase
LDPVLAPERAPEEMAPEGVAPEGVASEERAQRDWAVQVVSRLRAAGYEAYWAGGCVRDQLLGRAAKDYDVATNARPDEVRAVFGRRRTVAVGAAFGVIAVLGKKGWDPIEVATFRSDGEYRDGRHPESVRFTDARHDAQRRDFTINGLFYDPIKDQVIDYVDGRSDLRARRIRAIGKPQDRFHEDHLRMLRAVRFATTLEFELDADTQQAIAQLASHITTISAERIGAELGKILTHPQRSRGAELLVDTRLLEPLLQELGEARKTDPRAWEEMLRRGRRLGETTLACGLACWLAGLVPAQSAPPIARRLRWTNKQGQRAEWLLAALPYLADPGTPWPQLQRLLVHDGSAELMTLATAELGDEHPAIVRCREKLQMPHHQLDPLPLVSGNDLIAAGIVPGRHFTALLEFIREEQLDGRLHTRTQAIQAAQRWLQDQQGQRGGARPM